MLLMQQAHDLSELLMHANEIEREVVKKVGVASERECASVTSVRKPQGVARQEMTVIPTKALFPVRLFATPTLIAPMLAGGSLVPTPWSATQCSTSVSEQSREK